MKKIAQLRTQLTTQANTKQIAEKIYAQLEEEDIELLSGENLLLRGEWKKTSGRGSGSHVRFVGEGEENAVVRKDSIEDDTRSKTNDLGWADVGRNHDDWAAEKSTITPGSISNDEDIIMSRVELLKELAARLKRQKLLRYACRELEMQRLLMAKGGRKKVSGIEPVEGGNCDKDEDEDEIDSRKGRRRSPTTVTIDERHYKPRVYKWRMERKR